MKTSLRVIAALLVAAGLSVTSPSVVAAGPRGEDAAQKSYDEGQKLFDAGRYEQSLARFREAYAATGSPNARLMIARSLMSLGRLPEAYDEFVATRTEAAAKDTTGRKYEVAREGATHYLGELEPKVGKVVVALAEPEGARVTLNGASLSADRLGVPVAVMPGKVEVVVESADGSTMRREAEVPGGQTKTIFVAPGGGQSEAKTPAGAGSDPSTEEPTRTGGGVRIAGYVVAGLGVAGLGVFGVTTAMSQSKYDKMVEDCGGKRCTQMSYADVVDEGKRLDTIATASLIGGAAGVAIGAVMIAVGGPKEAKSPTARIEVGPGGAMLRVGGVF
ncbi:hypothetical protein [Polyangium aurulentum]|uniref:hypothetical protein n=1 Tax=Polyangium aurulentum TaxID=2567896 RepID=UPI0010ADA67B|nr:hypothetical protein [Polyangium aurulentum]UQA62989.1 hypothetical protein E8A73_022035 [Polyangium aurulentum]